MALQTYQLEVATRTLALAPAHKQVPQPKLRTKPVLQGSHYYVAAANKLSALRKFHYTLLKTNQK